MVNPRQHDWDAFQTLPLTVLTFYFLQAEIFLLNNGFRIFHSQPHVKHTLGEKHCFFLYMPNFAYISKINSFLDFKWKPLDNKSWEAHDATVSFMGQWLWGFMCLYNHRTHLQKNQKQHNERFYTQK